MRGAGLVLFMLSAIALGGGGCNGKARECNELIERMNANAGEIAKRELTGTDLARNAEITREIASLTRRAAERFQALVLEDAGLGQYARAYAEVLSGLSTATQTMAALIDEQTALNAEASGKASAALERTRADLEDACEVQDCRRFAQDLVLSIPADADENVVAEALRVYIERLRALEVGARLKPLVEARTAAARDYLVLAERSIALQKKGDENQATLDALNTRERGLVADINTACGRGPIASAPAN